MARFDKRKNHEKIVMALRNLKEKYPDIIYTCIGYGDEEENIKKLVNEFNNAEFNIEGYPTESFIEKVISVKPNQVTLVPDPPNVLTSSFG